MSVKRKLAEHYQSQIQAIFPRVSVTEHKGVVFMHLGTDWIQGAMRLSKPCELVLEYVQQMMSWMLFKTDPAHIVQLGLGSASLTKFCHAYFPHSRVTAVELNPAVIKLCHQNFVLPPDDEHLHVLEANALDYVRHHSRLHDIDILQVDLYDEDASAPALDSQEFYQYCAQSLTPDGIMMVNLFGRGQYHFMHSIEKMQQVFDAVVWLPEVHDANIVAMAFKNAPSVDFSTLYQQASAIRRQTNLYAKSWVDGLMQWMRDHSETIEEAV